MLEDTDECDVNFGKWINLHSRVVPVIVKDTVSQTPLAQSICVLPIFDQAWFRVDGG